MLISSSWTNGYKRAGAGLTSLGRSVDATIIDAYGWAELVDYTKSVMTMNTSMRHQWACHAALIGQAIVLDTWDVESWRGNNTNLWDWIHRRCNWGQQPGWG